MQARRPAPVYSKGLLRSSLQWLTPHWNSSCEGSQGAGKSLSHGCLQICINTQSSFLRWVHEASGVPLVCVVAPHLREPATREKLQWNVQGIVDLSTHRLYMPKQSATLWPLFTGIWDIWSPETVVIGNSRGIASSDWASRVMIGTCHNSSSNWWRDNSKQTGTHDRI